MLSRSARPLAEKALGPVVGALVRAGVRPDLLTWGGTLATCLVALTLLPTGHLALAGVLLAVLVLLDSLDGQVARRTGTTSTWGAFLDSTLDRVADAALFGALALWALTHLEGAVQVVSVAAAIGALSFALTTSYAKARAEAVGLGADVGLVERADRWVIVLAATVLVGVGLPAWVLTAALVLLTLAGLVTVAQRIAAVRRQCTGGGAS